MKKLGLQVLVHMSSAALVSRGSSLDFGIMSSYFTEETVTHFFLPELSSLCMFRTTFLPKYSSQAPVLIPDIKAQHRIVLFRPWIDNR